MPKIQDVLRLLAACEDPWVRAEVSLCDETPDDVIHLLVNDENTDVKKNAVVRYPSTPAERLTTMISNEIALGHNRDTKFLMDILAHPNLSVEDGQLLFKTLSPNQLVRAFQEDEVGRMNVGVYKLVFAHGVSFAIVEAAMEDHPHGREVDANTWDWYREKRDGSDGSCLWDEDE